MSATARDYQLPAPAHIDGLDDLFDDKIKRDQTLIQIDPDRKGIALEQAARTLNLHIDTVRRYLKSGKLRGFKAKDKFGNKWFVDEEELFLSHAEIQADQPLSKAPIQIDQGLVEDDQPLLAQEIQIDQGLVEDDQPLLRHVETSTVNVDVNELLRKLEGATYRIGWLEAQLEAERQQVKLLTDSQHKRGWWAKFSSWFFKAQ